MSRIFQNLAKSTTKIWIFFQKWSKMTQIYFWDRFWTALEKLLWESMISFLKKSFYDPLLGQSNFFFGPPKKRNISGGPRPPVNPAAYFRDPKNDPEASISTESALMCTHCTRNMLGTTFVSHTQPWKTTQHRQNREKQENHVVSLSHREF